jgi:hypothetical protein
MLNYHRINKHRIELSPANGGIFFVIFLVDDEILLFTVISGFIKKSNTQTAFGMKKM